MKMSMNGEGFNVKGDRADVILVLRQKVIQEQMGGSEGKAVEG